MIRRLNLSLRSRRFLLILIGIALIASVALALDLRFHGLAWRVIYSITGEETPFNQLYSFVTYLGNLTRRQPVTRPDIAVSPIPANPLGVNTFLQLEPDPAKVERQLQMVAAAGFGWIRQQFSWEDIEIHGRGDFVDRRNDPNGIDAWAKYDRIVDLAAKYKLNIIARLGEPPLWSEPPGTTEKTGQGHTPPVDFQDFVNFATTLATRYKGKITYYQVWNEPNVYPEWGEQPVNPEAYTDLLCRSYRALKQVDPAITVISGTLAPTVALSGRDLSDFVFLQRMYDAGAGRCFDILGMQGYGLFSGPTDQRMRITTINFSRPLWLRDIMIANGDATKPIWIGEMAWNPVPPESVAPEIQGRLNYGQVTDEQAARYAVEAYQRARKDWPWVGVIAYWYFKRPDDSEKSQSFYYFRLVDPDFTPRPAYNAIKAYATGQ